jgi:hypothetical protein
MRTIQEQAAFGRTIQTVINHFLTPKLFETGKVGGAFFMRV